MKVTFEDGSLEILETDDQDAHRYGRPVVRGFRKVINLVRQAADERDLWNMRSLNFERLKGDRVHEHSLRINDQWRLIVRVQEAKPKNTIVVVGIEDYH